MVNIDNRLLIFLVLLCGIGTVYATVTYMGGRQVFFTDQFYIMTEHWGKFDCFQFVWENQSQICLICKGSPDSVTMECIEQKSIQVNTSIFNITKNVEEKYYGR